MTSTGRWGPQYQQRFHHEGPEPKGRARRDPTSPWDSASNYADVQAYSVSSAGLIKPVVEVRFLPPPPTSPCAGIGVHDQSESAFRLRRNTQDSWTRRSPPVRRPRATLVTLRSSEESACAERHEGVGPVPDDEMIDEVRGASANRRPPQCWHVGPAR